MFYSDNTDTTKLRFGDVVKGNYLTALFCTTKCYTDLFKLEISNANYNVILTPCCSIQTKDELGNIIITPLIEIKASFFSNPYFKENMLNINRIIIPEKQVPPETWEKMNEKEKLKRLEEGPTYACKEYFIYEQNTLFNKYSLSNRSETINNIQYYMIDFRSTYNLKVENIQNPNNTLLKSKTLELSVETRRELNDKVQAFFRMPKEDIE